MECLNTRILSGKAQEFCSMEKKRTQYFSVWPVPLLWVAGFWGRVLPACALSSWIFCFRCWSGLLDLKDAPVLKQLLLSHLQLHFSCVKLLILQYWWPLGCSFIAFYKLYFIVYRRALSYLPEFTDNHKYLKDCHKYPVHSKFNPWLTLENYSSNISDATSFVAEHFGKNTALLW